MADCLLCGEKVTNPSIEDWWLLSPIEDQIIKLCAEHQLAVKSIIWQELSNQEDKRRNILIKEKYGHKAECSDCDTCPEYINSDCLLYDTTTLMIKNEFHALVNVMDIYVEYVGNFISRAANRVKNNKPLERCCAIAKINNRRCSNLAVINKDGRWLCVHHKNESQNTIPVVSPEKLKRAVNYLLSDQY